MKSSLKKEEKNSEDTSSSSSIKCVWFNEIFVREYPIILGDNPLAITGIPITIDWQFQKEFKFDTDSFELYRPQRKQKNELKLPSEKRVEL